MLPYDKPTWDRLRPAVDAALELDEPARDEFLDAMRTTDPELAALVSAFLANDRALDARGYLADTALDAFQETPRTTLHGTSLGHYTLVSPIGHGGMGQVWRATRSDGRYEGAVAIKLLNLSLIGGTADQRFRREGSILARLSHPNIARLIDAGVSDAGQPYLVLEYVDGTRLDTFCDSRQLSVPGRIRLVIQVLDAVSHAHASLIVHRDLKPANILVNSAGDVKLLDFGIAKLLETDDEAALTLTGGRALTPEYAAPEQILGEPITTRTDVYAAGLLLFQLLAGVHPTADGASSASELLRASATGDAMHLSDAVRSTVSRSDEAARQAAANRGSTIAQLSRAYRHTLDNILAKALRRAPEDRYQSVAALADDLRRYLAHEVVTVRADSVGYRLTQFVRRHTGAVITACAVAAALGGAAIVSWKQMRIAQAARAQSDATVRSSRAIGEVQLQLLTLVESGPEKLTADQRLARVQKIVAARYRNDPRMHAAILTMLADRYGQLENLNRQSELQLTAAELARSVQDDAGEAQMRCIAAWVMYRSDRTDSAEVQLTRAQSLLRGRPADASQAAVLACNSAMATRHLVRQQFDSALTRMRASLTLLTQAGDTLSSDFDVVLNYYGSALNQAGRPREALAQVTRLRTLKQQKGETESDGYVTTAANIAAALLGLGEFASARALLESEIARVHPPGSTAEVPLFFRIRSMMTYRRLGMVDSVRRLAAELAADTVHPLPPALLLDVRLSLADALLLGGRSEEARAVVSAARPLLAKLPKQPRARAQMVLVDAALVSASRGPAAALDTLRQFLGGAGYAPGTKLGTWLAPVLVQASDYALATGDPRSALTFATDALAEASLDSLAVLRSAYTGNALAAAARATLASGDTIGARQLASRAMLPLRYGFGAASAQVASNAFLLTTAPPIRPARR